jgi:hypothetical protein
MADEDNPDLEWLDEEPVSKPPPLKTDWETHIVDRAVFRAFSAALESDDCELDEKWWLENRKPDWVWNRHLHIFHTGYVKQVIETQFSRLLASPTMMRAIREIVLLDRSEDVFVLYEPEEFLFVFGQVWDRFPEFTAAIHQARANGELSQQDVEEVSNHLSRKLDGIQSRLDSPEIRRLVRTDLDRHAEIYKQEPPPDEVVEKGLQSAAERIQTHRKQIADLVRPVHG